MEDIYTIKVKSKPDTRNIYPSERRYSASTVSGLAWVHIALSATSFLLALLALFNPNTGKQVCLNSTLEINKGDKNDTDICNSDVYQKYKDVYILVIAACVLSAFALATGATSVMASVRWYIDRNISWLFFMSILSTAASFTAFVMVIVWLGNTTDYSTAFYKEKTPYKAYFVFKNSDVIDKNETHIVMSLNATDTEEDTSLLFTKNVLSINILIACFLELIWSILSVRISYKGMTNTYKDDDVQRRGNCVAIVTKIKGNNAKKFQRNGQIMTPKPNLIENYTSRKIDKILLAHNNSFYLKNQNNKGKQNTETSSDFYKERMMNFLNRCASLEGISNPDVSPSVQSENVLNPIPEVASVDMNFQEPGEVTPISWGDTPEHTIYNPSNLNLQAVFNFNAKKDEKNDCNTANPSDKPSEELSENAQI